MENIQSTSTMGNSATNLNWKRVYLVLGICVFLILFIIYIIFSRNTSNNTQLTVPNNDYRIYTNNSLHISITYPIQASVLVGCDSLLHNTNSKNPTHELQNVPVAVYEDLPDNAIYIAAETFSVVSLKQIAPGAFQGIASCIVNNTTINDLKNDVSSFSTQYNFVNEKFSFANVTNDTQFLSFIHKQFGNNVSVASKKLVDTATQSFSYILKSNSSQVGEDDTSTADKVIYSAQKRLAIAWTENIQQPEWQIVDNSGNFRILQNPEPIVTQ